MPPFKQDISHLRPSAMQEGLVIGLYLIVKFFIDAAAAHNMYLYPISALLIIALPFFLVWRGRVYRNKFSSDGMSYSHAYLFIFVSLFFASLLLAICRYVYTTVIVPDYWYEQPRLLAEQLLQYRDLFGSKMIDDLSDGLLQGKTPTSIQAEMNILFSNLVYGNIAALVLALFVKRSPKQKNL